MREPLTDSKSLKGYTLVEVLVVVAIMGILSSMGVVGLQGAVQNSRIKDAALNTTAFLERVANEANKRSETLCIAAASSQKIIVVSGCGTTNEEIVDKFEIDSPMEFSNNACGIESKCSGCSNWLTTNASNIAKFKPKLGLSAAPVSGYVSIKYSGTDLCAAAVKTKNKNSISAMVYNGSWSEL